MKIRNWLIVLLGLWVCVIFSFSLQPAEVSSDTSMGFVSKVLGFFLPRVMEYIEGMSQGQLDVFHHFVRKCAHFTEYLILGVMSAVTGIAWNVRKYFRTSILFCVGIASVDEVIQLFVDGRAGRIQDVVLDGVGAAAGICFICFICSVKKSKRDLRA